MSDALVGGQITMMSWFQPDPFARGAYDAAAPLWASLCALGCVQYALEMRKARRGHDATAY